MSQESKVRVDSEFLSLDTAFDGWVHRPWAKRVSRWLVTSPIHPNHLTLASLLPALAAAVFFARGRWSWGLCGLLAFWSWAVLDHADGELARTKGLVSEFGKKLDDACDSAASGVMMTGIFWGLVSAARPDRPAFWWVCFAAVVLLNETTHHLALEKKRQLRALAVQRGAADAAVVKSQKMMDHFSGREPFYVLILLFIAATAHAPVWPRTLLQVLIVGTASFALFGFLTWIFLSKQLAKERSL